MVRDVIIIGAGVIGATVAQAFRLRGEDVFLVDDGRPMSGTRPSGGHLRPEWFGGMPSSEYGPAMDLLDQTWGVRQESFTLYPIGIKVGVSRVDTDTMLLKVDGFRTIGRVDRLRCLDNYPIVEGQGWEERGRLLIVAAGVWCSELLPRVKQKVKQGVSFRLAGQLEAPLIKPWAPYKQVVAHQQAPGVIWAGDGSAVYPQNWGPERTAQCLGRCQTAIGLLPSPPLRACAGLRPYALRAKSEPCLLEQIGPRVWVATGAGKMGTIAAGWVANRLLKMY